MRKILLAAAAMASVAIPALSFAQDYQDHHGPAAQDQHPHADQHPDQHPHADQHPDQHPRPDQPVRPDIRQDVRQEERHDWDHSHLWNRGDRFWWRGRPEFQAYYGPRPGYWYIPGSGYIKPDPRWYGYNWRVGGFVPRSLWNYTVVNPYIYGLPPIPPAARYIYLGNNIALISIYDGHIVRLIPNVY